MNLSEGPNAHVQVEPPPGGDHLQRLVSLCLPVVALVFLSQMVIAVPVLGNEDEVRPYWVSPFARFCISIGLTLPFIIYPAFVCWRSHEEVTVMTMGQRLLWGFFAVCTFIGVFSLPNDWWNRLLNYYF